jgi:CRP/FNR family cyclic AMP-dependent transcriptional regulator
VADTVDVPAGRTIVREGRTVREFVVLVRGTAAAADGEGHVLLAPGAYFGEMGLIDGRPHPRDVQTLTATRLLVFDARAFRGLLERIPSVGRKLLGEMVARLRVANQDSRSLRAVS